MDSTTLEANAALRSIVRRDDGSGYEEWLEALARSSGIDTLTRSDLAKLDRKRPKKGSNEDWVHPGDPEARITKMKDGRTHLAHKLEQASDMDSGAIVAVTVQTMDGGDCASMPNTLEEAERQLGGVDAQAREVVADKGYHSNATMKRLKAQGLRSYVSEPQRGRRNWKRDRAAQQPTYDNRRRVRGARGKRLLRQRGEKLERAFAHLLQTGGLRGARGKRLLRQRGEKLERAFAHLLQTGGLRRAPVRGQENIRKRLLVHAAAFNLGLLMRHRHGVGTPRSLQGRAAAVYLSLFLGLRRLVRLLSSIFGPSRPLAHRISPLHTAFQRPRTGITKIRSEVISATGC